ncbi:DUF4158 domain-containing protein [Streptomyces rimosus]|uniref:DUF4158 domain-containing protein n=1 Tax=Streptomyces rimosus TaxID=1927 RepID=UPI0037B0DA0B
MQRFGTSASSWRARSRCRGRWSSSWLRSLASRTRRRSRRYTERRRTLYDHAWEIRDAYGYHPYEDAEWGRRFRTFLHGRAWTHAEGPRRCSTMRLNGCAATGCCCRR